MPEQPRSREDWDHRLRWPIGILLVGLIAVALFSSHWLPTLAVLVIAIAYLLSTYLRNRE